MPEHKHIHENRTMWVVLLTAITMVVEIIFGLITNSMALLADGIHMGSHVLAIGLSWLAMLLSGKFPKAKILKEIQIKSFRFRGTAAD